MIPCSFFQDELVDFIVKQNTERLITLEQALNSLVNNLNLTIYNPIDLSAIQSIEINGELFYLFPLAYFNEEVGEAWQ